jgi:hypothetical protein
MWSNPVKVVATKESLEWPHYLEHVSKHEQLMVVDDGGKFEEVEEWEAPREGLQEWV